MSLKDVARRMVGPAEDAIFVRRGSRLVEDVSWL